MKTSTLPLLTAAALLALASCNQTAPSAEQAGTAAAPTTETSTAEAAESPAGAGESAAATPSASAAAPQVVELSFRFKELPRNEMGQTRSSAFLKMSGKEPREIDLGPFVGKPDEVDETEAKRAGFPSNMLVGFRSYDSSSGIGADLAVMPGEGGRVRIVQRRVDETADKPAEFQTAREIPMPANSELKAAPVAANKDDKASKAK